MSRTDALVTFGRLFPTRFQEPALQYFAEINPHYKGAAWIDCLDVLLEADAHLEITEPAYEALAALVPIEHKGWILPVTLTLLYARKGAPPFTVDVAYWHGYVSAKEESHKEGGDAIER